MAFDDIVAYQYEAGYHCISCTKKKWEDGLLMPTPETISLYGSGVTEKEQDQNGIPYSAADDVGNTVHPLFPTDEWMELDPDYLKENPVQILECDTCHTEITRWKEGE
jgi:hypothetical protein